MNQKSFHALILAGGLGKRLRNVVSDLPKSMAPISNLPFLHYMIDYLKLQNINKILILTGYKSNAIEEYFGNGSSFGVSIRYSREKELLGTAGALKNAEILINENTFFLINGDTFFPCDLSLLLEQHAKNNAQATIALKLLPNTSRYGSVNLEDSNRISAFIEKSNLKDEGYINGGIYVLDRKVLNRIPSAKVQSLEKDVFPQLENCYGLPMGDCFIDIGIPEDYSLAQELIPRHQNRKKKRAAFLDRDGIIIEDIGYVHTIEKAKLCKGIFRFCRKAIDAGYLIIVVTNQAGIAKGIFPKEEADALNAWLIQEFGKKNLRIADVFTCPYHEQAKLPDYKRSSLYRKPEPGMILEAAQKWNIDLTKSFMVGDKLSDRIKLSYMPSYIIKSQYVETGYDFASLDELRDKILLIN